MSQVRFSKAFYIIYICVDLTFWMEVQKADSKISVFVSAESCVSYEGSSWTLSVAALL